MLKRQQAQALIEARTTIVRGSIEVCHHAVQELERKGIPMDDDDKARLTNDLLTVICGDQGGN